MSTGKVRLKPDTTSRRDFAKTLGLGTIGLGLGPSVFARQSAAPFPAIKNPRYRNWSDDALREAKRLGCTYADLRFTLNRSNGVAVRNGEIQSGGNVGFGQFGDVDIYGCGVRVIHSGVWGFSSSPNVNPEEIAWRRSRRTTRSGRRRSRLIRGASRSMFGNAAVTFNYEWKFLATSEGSFIEQVFYYTAASISATARKDGVVKTRTFDPGTETRGWEFVTDHDLKGNAERVAEDADGDRLHLQRDHHGLLGKPRRSWSARGVAAHWHGRRRERAAGAIEPAVARRVTHPASQDHGRNRVQVETGSG